MKRGSLLFFLLAGSVMVAGLVAWEATRAARAERATAEAVLRDYASFAAWEYARGARQQIDATLDNALAALTSVERRRGIEQTIAAKADADPVDPCGCGPVPREVRAFFHVSAGGEWRTVGEPVGVEVRDIVTPSQDDGRHMHSPIQMRITTSNGVPALLAWRTDRQFGDRVVRGFVAERELLKPALKMAERATPLLPPALTSRANAHDVVRVSVTDLGGDILHQAAVWRSDYAGQTSLDDRLGGLRITAAIDPESAPMLVIGGLPKSRLPFIYGLIAFAAVLTGVALVQLRRELALARMRSDFVSGVSHELRTPLAQIRMFAETLALGRVRSADESRRSLEIILQESQRLSQLVDNVLCFSRVERGMVSLHRERVSLNRMLETLIDSVQPLARARRATVRLAVPAELDAHLDEASVRQMLLNLIDNALKYGPAGQTITIGAMRSANGLRIWVDDEGPGVAGADAERIWEPFWRGDHTAQGGSGIGLAIVRELATTHGGSVRVEAAPTGGARFVIELADLPAAA
jgi:signal transduction histidine kinase